MSTKSNSIDYDVIESLKELIDDDDPDFVVELLQEYLENADMNIRIIREATAANDAEKLTITAHTLKGASGNVGAVKMASLSKQLEEFGKNDNTHKAVNIVKELQNEFSSVREELQAEIDSL